MANQQDGFFYGGLVLDTTSRQILDKESFIFLAFCFLKHPVRKDFFLQLSLYKNIDNKSVVLCMSEGRGKGSINKSKLGLGGTVKGKLISAFAQRGFYGEDWESLSEVIQVFKDGVVKDNPSTLWYEYVPNT